MNRFISLLALSLLGSALATAASPQTGVLVDSYAAIVNGRVITLGDVLAALEPLQERLSLQYAGSELEQRVLEAYNSIRDSLVESELILLDFEMQGGTLPDRAIEDHINTVIHDRFGNDRAEFLRALAAERLTFAEWRQQMKEQLIVQIMRQREISSKILITPLDLQTAYDRQRDTFSRPEQIRIRILSFAAGQADAAADLRERILAGDLAFEAAAAEGITLQDDPEFIELASLHETIRTAPDGLAPADLSDPVEIEGAPYLVQQGGWGVVY